MSRTKWVLLVILAVNFALNVWGIEWGLPERWHPDELLDKAEIMYELGEINHNYYTYGGWPFYVIELLAIAPTNLGQAFFGWHDFEVRSTATLLARLISALMGTGIVAATYGIGSTLFERRTGLISAALTGLVMGLVNLAHFATVDVASLFWFSLASLLAVKAWRTGSSKAYVGAGVCSGLAAAVRFVGGIAILVVLTAHWWRRRAERRHDRLVLAVGSAVIALVIANAPMVLLPCYFVIGYIKDFFFNGLRNAEGPRAWLALASDYSNATGWPLALLSLGGIVYAIWLLGQKKWRPQIWLIAAMVLPYYALVGRMHVSHLRYALPLAPFILILTGKMLSDFTVELTPAPGGHGRKAVGVRPPVRGFSAPAPRGGRGYGRSPRGEAWRGEPVERFTYWQRRFWQLVLALSLIYSFGYVTVADLNFINDARGQLDDWLMSNVAARDQLEITSYVSDTAQWFYPVTRRPHDNAEWSTRRALAANRLYHGLLSGTQKLEKRAQRIGICAADLPTYQTWNELAVKKLGEEAMVFDLGSEGIRQRRPDWLIVSSLYYDRFAQEAREPEAAFFRDLWSNTLPYQLVEEMQYRGWPGMRPQVEFVNPKLRVYKLNKLDLENSNQ